MTHDDLTEKDSDRAAPSDFSDALRAYFIVHSAERADVIVIPPTGYAIIGRGADVALPINDRLVSRQHARVGWQSGELFVEDLGSHNGTVVNGEVVRGSTRRLHGGDSIRIGRSEIAVAIAAAPPSATEETGPIRSVPPTIPARSGPSRRPVAQHDAGNAHGDALDGVIVADPSMARVFGFARRVATTTTTALILGETGAGKEVVAQQLHRWSDRSARRFIRVNCAALQESLVESELFGHERGAFTGADKRKIGFAEAAHEGTLFLDEIGELSLPVQAKLLAMLENRSVVRVGSTVETPIDVRVIAATHRSLQKEVAEGRFREDLYYRISVVVIRVPPLRERPSEIMLLANLFARRFGPPLGWNEPVIARDASDALVAHSWPGNIRELRNTMEHAMLLTENGTIRREHLPDPVIGAVAHVAPARTTGGVRAALAEVERASIEQALLAEGGNRTRAALQLGISLRALLYKIRKYGITD